MGGMMSDALMPARARCFLLWAALGGGAGLITSAIYTYLQPRIYQSTARIAAQEHRGRTVELSTIHAAQALQLVSRAGNDGSRADEVSRIRAHTHITAGDGWVDIRVLSTDNVEACQLAFELAYLFRGMDEEQQLAGTTSELRPLSDEQLKVLQLRQQVARLMNHACREGGLPPVFQIIPTQANRGLPPAQALWASEDFQRHYKYHEQLTWQICGDQGPTGTPLPLLQAPDIAIEPFSPKVDLLLSRGLVAGAVMGALLGWRRGRRIQQNHLPPHNHPPSTPAYAQVEPPPLPGSTTRKHRPHFPEDDW
jgi:hypothetical protein